MSATPSVRSDEQVFRGRLTLIINLLCTATGTILFVVLLVSVVVEPPNNGSGTGGAVIASIAIVVLAGLLVRSSRASMLLLRHDELMYRTLLGNRRVPRSQIVGVRLEKGGFSRGGGAMKAWIPVLDLADGSSLWLREMKAGIRGSIDYPDTYNEYTRNMMTGLQGWAGVPRSQNQSTQTA